MIKLHRTLIFAAITIGLTWYVYFYEYKKSDDGLSERSRILKFDPDQITSLQVIKEDFKVSLLKSETGWNLTEPISEAGDTDRISELLMSLANEKVEATVKVADAKLSEVELREYGLDKPLAVLSFKNNAGLIEQVSVGNIKNMEGQSYIQVDAGPKVLLSSSLWYNRAKDTLITYRDKRLLRASVSSVNRIKITNLQHNFELKRVDGKWVSPQHDYDLDQSKMRDIVKKIADSSIEEYVFEGEPSHTLLVEKQMDKAAVELEITTDKGSWAAKLNTNSHDNSLYLLADRPTYLAKVSPLIWETIATLSLDSLRDRTSAFYFNAEEVKKIYYKNNDRDTNLIFNSGSWLMGATNTPYFEVDKTEIAKTIKKIRELQISEFIDGETKDKFVGQNMLILKSETEKLLLQLNWGPAFKMTKNGVDSDYYYARTHLSDRIFALEKSEIEKLNLEPEKIAHKRENVGKPGLSATENK